MSIYYHFIMRIVNVNIVIGIINKSLEIFSINQLTCNIKGIGYYDKKVYC